MADFLIDETAEFDAGSKTSTVTDTDEYKHIADQVQLSFPYADKDADLQMYLRFESEAAGVTPDGTANNNDGNVNGATGTVNGKFDNAYSFDGDDDRIQVADDASLDITSDLTLVAWVKRAANGANHYIINKYRATLSNRAYFMRIGSDDKIHFLISKDGTTGGGQYSEVISISTITDTNWHMVVATFKASTTTMKVYIDSGTADNTNSSAVNGINANNESLYISGTLGSGNPVQFFNGTIDEPKVYSRCLSDSEVGDLYNSGNQYVASGVWESATQTMTAGKKMMDTTITHSSLSATEKITEIRWQVGGVTKATYATDITTGASTEIAEGDLTSGTFDDVDANFTIEIDLAGGGTASPVITQVEGDYVVVAGGHGLLLSSHRNRLIGGI